MIFLRQFRYFILDCLREFKSSKDLQILLAVALALRLGYFILMLVQLTPEQIMTLSPDTIRYVGLGKELLNWRIMDEAAALHFGPGYGAFLGTVFFLFGVNPVGVLMVQIILSGLSCLMIFRLARELTHSTSVGYIAGILLAVSFTSISLANFILSDTLFFFLFLWGTLAFLLALKNRKLSYFIFSGICIGLSILTRSIGQFWPVVMVAMIFFLPLGYGGNWQFRDRWRLFKKAWIAPLIAIALMSIWVARNYHHHSVIMLTFSSAGGPANVAARALSRIQGKDANDILLERIDAYLKQNGLNELGMIDRYRLYRSIGYETFRQHPFEMIYTWMGLAWINLNEVNQVYLDQIPAQTKAVGGVIRWYRSLGLNYVSFVLSMAAMFLLLMARKWRALLILAAIYFYFTAMIGFTQWQGSRLFYPGQMASVIAIAYLLAGGIGVIRRGYTDVFKGSAFARVLPSLVSGVQRVLRRMAEIMEEIRPDENRYYFVFFIVATMAGLIYLYRDFIFSNRLFSSYDMINSGIFFRSFLARHVAAFGKVPVWNPYILCGLPYVDAIHGDIFYPLSFLKFILPIHRAIGWTFILHIFFAGVFAWMAAREMNFSRTAAGLVGTAYMFAGWLNSQVKPGHDSKIYVTALFPLLFFFMHRAFRSRPILNYTMLGTVQGCILLSPHPQMAYFCLWALAAYAVYNILTRLPVEGRIKFMTMHVGLTTYAVALALMLSAIQFLPTFEYTRNDSPRILHRNNYNFSAGWSMHAEEAFSLVLPEFAGAGTGYPGTVYWGRNVMKDNSEAVGLAAVLLALIGMVYSKRREKYFFAALAAGALVYALGDSTPIFRYLYQFVPFVKMTRAPSMIMFVFSFAICLLAGMGIEAVIGQFRDGMPDRRIIIKFITLALPPLFLIGWYLFLQAGEETMNFYARLFYPELLERPGQLRAAYANLPAIRSGLMAAFLVSASLSAMVWSIMKWRLAAAATMIITLLVIVDGVRFDQRFVRTEEPAREFSETPLIRYLKNNAGDYRVCGLGLDELRLQLGYHGISSPLGYHGNEPVWYYRFLHWGPGVPTNRINPRFTGLAGVRYFLTPSGMDLDTHGYGDSDIVRQAEFDGIEVVENKNCLPRTYLVGQYEVVDELDSIFRLIYQGDDDLRRLVYLENDPADAIDSLFRPGDTAFIIHYSTDSVVIRATCSTSKILVLSDVYFEDWHGYVDGREEETLRTYGIYRGVRLKPGRHTVLWRYIPRNYYAGRMMTLGSSAWILLVLIAAAIYGRRTRW